MQKLLQYLGLSDFNTAFALTALSDACFLMQDKQQKQSPRKKKNKTTGKHCNEKVSKKLACSFKDRFSHICLHHCMKNHYGARGKTFKIA